MLNRDTISALVLLALTGYSWFFQVKKLPQLSRVFPQVCLAVLTFLAILLLIQGLRKSYDQGLFQGVRLTFVKYMAGAITVYLVLINYIGFFAASFIFIMTSGLVFDAERTRKTVTQSALVGILATIVFYLVFQKIFNVPFPTGALWN